MALEPDKYLIGLVVFTILMISGVMIMQDLDQNYEDVDISTSDFGESFNMTGELYNLSQDIGGSTFGKDIDDDDTPNSMFSGAFAALRFLRDSFRLVGNILESIFEVIPIPPVYKTLALTILTISVIFSLIYLIFRFQPRK